MMHVLDSTMLYIHPTLAIVGYFFIFLSVYFFMVQYKYIEQGRHLYPSLYLAWFFTLCGLLTGMIWAGSAWHAYWSWDPKETMTLLIFICLCMSILLIDKKKKYAFLFLISSSICVLINLLLTIGGFGLHAY